MRRLAPLLALLIACSSPTATENGLLSVSSRDGIVRITNRSAQPVLFILATRTHLELVEPLPCTKPGGCTPTLPGGSSIAVPFSEILGYEPGVRTAVLIHWLKVGASPDDVYRTVLLLRR
ncbi:MAG: hypothetical protein H0W30_04305 [Gemmatimonadaceae bacterium]|nr:hypothetical protein [Gemmatimonadaceae bacterium]MDQ3520319.1 hypothetical protein [Gemmatimonadota bacterium]